jgi:hypothetical protein
MSEWLFLGSAAFEGWHGVRRRQRRREGERGACEAKEGRVESQLSSRARRHTHDHPSTYLPAGVVGVGGIAGVAGAAGGLGVAGL